MLFWLHCHRNELLHNVSIMNEKKPYHEDVIIKDEIIQETKNTET